MSALAERIQDSYWRLGEYELVPSGMDMVYDSALRWAQEGGGGWCPWQGRRGEGLALWAGEVWGGLAVCSGHLLGLGFWWWPLAGLRRIGWLGVMKVSHTRFCKKPCPACLPTNSPLPTCLPPATLPPGPALLPTCLPAYQLTPALPSCLPECLPP